MKVCDKCAKQDIISEGKFSAWDFFDRMKKIYKEELLCLVHSKKLDKLIEDFFQNREVIRKKGGKK